ncbi:MAG: LptA/OstA family protein [Pseudomonadota bacterium]
MRVRRFATLGIVLSAGFVCSVAANPVRTVSQSVTVRSDEATVDFRSGVRTYEGGVAMVHRNFRLFAERVIETHRDGAVEKVEANGKPVRFRQDPPISEGLSHGAARKAVYSVSKRELRLWDYEVTDTRGNVMRGKRSKYIFQ